MMMIKTDAQLKRDVESELEWEPAIDAEHVGVAVTDGVVTLTGHLGTFAEKHAAERAAQRVLGIKGVAVEIDVRLGKGHQRTDADIAAAAQTALRWNVSVPVDAVKVMVEMGWVTLSGEVPWNYQRQAAVGTVRPLIGVLGVSDEITVKARATPADVKGRIRDALERRADREAKRIEVVVDGATVTLEGRVHSWAERMAAQGAAWSAPGIRSVVNHLQVA